MSEKPHKPVRMPSWRLEMAESEEDAIWRLHPERHTQIAHDTAQALVRGKSLPERQEILARLTRFVDREGLDILAELWSQADRSSLPRALYLLYRVREQVIAHPEAIAAVVDAGLEQLNTIDPVVLGTDAPVSGREVIAIIGEVLAGTFAGSIESALLRASALCRVVAAGLLHWRHDDADPERNGDSDSGHALALQSLSWGVVGEELAVSAARERSGILS